MIGDRFERRLVEETSRLRVEISQELGVLRDDMAKGFGLVRQEMAQHRVELLKWAFMFWVGQFCATASLAALLVRLLRPAG